MAYIRMSMTIVASMGPPSRRAPESFPLFPLLWAALGRWKNSELHIICIYSHYTFLRHLNTSMCHCRNVSMLVQSTTNSHRATADSLSC